MRRLVLAVLAAGALAVPGAAAGDLSGPGPLARGQFRIGFNVDYDGKKPKRITRFRFWDVVISCKQGPEPNPFTTRSLAPHFGPLPVNREGRFGRVFSSAGQTFDGEVVIRGEFLTRRRVEGTLRISGDYPSAGYSGCGSGRLEWAATIG